jgi:hypothetical protein
VITVGPASKVKPSCFPDIGAAAGLLAALDHGDVEAGGLQADGQGQAAEAGADNRRARLGMGHTVLSSITEASLR